MGQLAGSAAWGACSGCISSHLICCATLPAWLLRCCAGRGPCALQGLQVPQVALREEVLRLLRRQSALLRHVQVSVLAGMMSRTDSDMQGGGHLWRFFIDLQLWPSLQLLPAACPAMQGGTQNKLVHTRGCDGMQGATQHTLVQNRGYNRMQGAAKHKLLRTRRCDGSSLELPLMFVCCAACVCAAQVQGLPEPATQLPGGGCGCCCSARLSQHAACAGAAAPAADGTAAAAW
jgi:hypothetical protein